jgi:hypothetical protein
MSISKKIASGGDNKLVIPYAGKMFRSNIASDNKALCFAINKGYIEAPSLDELLMLLDSIEEIPSIIKVGNTEKIHISTTDTMVYRQRLFFKSLRVMLNICKTLGLKFELTSDFHISINNIMNCTEELVYLERYANKFDQTIDVWLTNCCIIHLNFLLLSMNMYSDLVRTTNKILKNKKGYLDRAPFLIASYDIDKKSSGIFLESNLSDTRLYSSVPDSSLYLTFGYTTKNVKSDVKGGAFN